MSELKIGDKVRIIGPSNSNEREWEWSGLENTINRIAIVTDVTTFGRHAVLKGHITGATFPHYYKQSWLELVEDSTDEVIIPPSDRPASEGVELW